MGEGPVRVGASPEREDRPYLRPLRSPPWTGMAWLAVLLLAAGAGVGYYFWQSSRFEPAPVPQRAAPAPAERAAPAEPAIRHPLAAETAAEPLPALAESDAALREALERLVGSRALAALLQPDRVVARIVATVDNLPRQSAPQRVMPLKPAPGAFETENGRAIGARNAARYEAYMALVRAVDARACVDLYVRFYPLFQQAYAELGYPKAYFNDRLIEAIDDLLAAPEPKDPVALARPKVLYEYADPALESRSAGQKVLLRMGGANAAKVKAKLREIRAELLKRQRPS
jgi:hypothetical protein